MHKQNFGHSKLANEDVGLYEITNEKGLKVKILSFGAAIQSINLPWKGKNQLKASANVVLGYSSIEDYEINDCYLGVAVGRVAGRISNAKFEVNNKCFNVTKNHGSNCLHGGRLGLSRKNWVLESQTSDSVTLSYVSPDGEEGFPGEMKITIMYKVTSDNNVIIKYEATVTKHPCPINVTNHSYFNLSGIEHAERGVKDHVVQINASKTLELDANLLPNGKVIALAEHYNLKANKEPLEKMIAHVGNNPKGFDNYYIFDKVGLEHCQATVTDGITKMSLYTDQIGVQFYTSNFFNNVKCSDGIIHQQYGALCLEAQNYPDAINHPNFPSILLNPGQVYTQTTIYKFEKA